jgi:hypothetical protein
VFWSGQRKGGSKEVDDVHAELEGETAVPDVVDQPDRFLGVCLAVTCHDDLFVVGYEQYTMIAQPIGISFFSAP